MNGFNFGRIGDIISKVMDTDYIDIRRDIEGQLVEVYSNIPCHIAYVSIDNPNAETVDIKPIIQGITIHFPLWVDVRNNDFIIAKKVDVDGAMGGVYSGRCGNPVVSQGRKKVLMNMDATEPEQPTPIPPDEYFNVTVSYTEMLEDAVSTNPVVSDDSYVGEDWGSIAMVFVYSTTEDSKIKDDLVENVEKGDDFTMGAPLLDGYLIHHCVVDGVRVEGSSVSISDVQAPHTVKFVYVKDFALKDFKFLVNGLYTKNDGSLANGWHSYKPVDMDSITFNGSIYTITSDNVEFEHLDNGKILSISTNTLIVFSPKVAFAKIDDVVVSNGKATFTAYPYTPTDQQKAYYDTRWYD